MASGLSGQKEKTRLGRWFNVGKTQVNLCPSFPGHIWAGTAAGSQVSVLYKLKYAVGPIT